MGNKNSSKTRVQPVFGNLLREAPSGKPWLSALLGLAGHGSPLAQRLASDPGSLPPQDAAQCFERRLPPPSGFLTWLVQHPERMSWPVGPDHALESFGADTQEWREMLFGQHGAEEQRRAQREALARIAKQGVGESARKWWAFEGFTSVDCCLETDKLLLLVEGKRTDVLKRKTDWFKDRNQLARNLEVAKETAHNKEYAVLLIAENARRSIPEDEIKRGFPHFSEHERESLIAHCLGPVTWRDVCEVTGLDYDALPNTVEE